MSATARKIRDDELLIERTFDAPLELVFRLWESRDHMIRWWGPEQFTCLELDWEMKPGRAWRARMVAKEWKVTGMGGIIASGCFGVLRGASRCIRVIARETP